MQRHLKRIKICPKEKVVVLLCLQHVGRDGATTSSLSPLLCLILTMFCFGLMGDQELPHGEYDTVGLNAYAAEVRQLFLARSLALLADAVQLMPPPVRPS